MKGLISRFFRALGWQTKAETDQQRAFCSTLAALGVEFDLQNLFTDGHLVIRNTEERSKKIAGLIQGVVAKGSSTPPDAQRLAGKLYHYTCQTFGRVGRAQITPITQRAAAVGSGYLAAS